MVPQDQQSVQISDLSVQRHRSPSDHLQSKLSLGVHFCLEFLDYLPFQADLVFLVHQEYLPIQVLPFLPQALLLQKLLVLLVDLEVP